MTNPALVRDYLSRAQNRLAALGVFFERRGYADIVRLSQECVELALKSLVRSAGIEPPRDHDVGRVLLEHSERFPESVRADLPRLAEISHNMRRDRELAFYGLEDLTPLEFYGQKHAEAAQLDATWAVQRVERALELERTVDSQRGRGGPKRRGPGR